VARWSLCELIGWAAWYVLHIALFAKCEFWQLQHLEIVWLHNCSSLHRLTVGSGFGLTFWIRPDPTRPAKDPSLAPRGLNIEIFPVFGFRITFLHYLLIGSHEGEHEGRLVEIHDEKHEEKHEGEHEGEHGEEHGGEHEGKHEGKTWRPFDFGRESWRGNMVGSYEGDHEGCLTKLFTSI